MKRLIYAEDIRSCYDIVDGYNGMAEYASIQKFIDATPTVTIIDDIKKEIKNMKEKQNSTNTDYVTGYISALSTLEGYIVVLEHKEDD